jgi:YD repeat-containing protein
MMRIRAAAILLATSLLPLAAYAGDDPLTNRGVNLNSVYHVGDIDTVNLFNGNLIIDVPMAAQFPLNGGFSYGIHLIYSGQPWDFPQYEREDPDQSHPPPREWIWKPFPIPNRRSNAGVGWRVSMGRLIPPWDPTNTNCDRGTFDGCDKWVYESPDGADHRVGNTNPGYSADGSYLRLKSYTNNGITYREIEFPDGMIHRFNDIGNLTAIYTPFDRAANAGPSVNVAYLTGASSCGDAGAESCWKISDLFGRTQYVTFVSTAGAIYDHQLAQKIIVTAPGSATVAYSLHYTNVNLYLDHIACYHSPDDTAGRWTDFEYYNVPLLTSIGLPDGSDYEIATYQNEPPQCSHGSIQSLTLPTKGSIGYTYTNWSHNHRGSLVETGHGSPYVPGVELRTKTPAGSGASQVWTYLSTPGDNATFSCGGCSNPPHEDRERKVTVTDPDGRAVRHYFSIADNAETGGWTRYEYGLPLTHRAGTSTTDPLNGQTRYLSSEALDAGSVERFTYVKYEYEIAETDARPGRYPREQASLTLYADGTGHDAGRWSSVNRSSFDYFGHYRQTETDGNFASEGTTGFDHRTELTDYNPGKSAFDGWLVASPWVLNTFDMQTVTTPKIGPNDALTSHTKKTEFCFEADTGFLKRRRVLRYDPTTRTGSGRDGTDLITVFGRVPEHTSDANPNDVTGNLYSERSYGGDGATLADGSLCSISLASQRYEIQHRYQYGVRRTSQYFRSDGTAMPFFTLDRTIDPSGSVSKERDVAGVETTYTPDPDDPLRIKTVATAGSDAITYTYSNASVSGSTFTPAQIAVTQSDVSSSVQYDSFGRMWHEFRTMPTIGEVKRETLYDSSNRKLSQSMWDSSSYANKTIYTYDFLGRVDSVTPPDGQIVRTSYLGDGKRTTTSEVVTSTDATPAKTTVATVEQLDRYGRIWYLKEPNDTVTAYGYGVTGALARVCMNASLSTSGVLSTANCGQERTFDYDNAGLLKSEAHPENGTVSYTYDALGHVLTKRLSAAGIFDLNYTYDDAERLQQVDSRQTATSTTFRVSKLFEFGTSNDGSNKRLGKLETATRHNYRPVSGGADIDIRAVETYAYNDAGGRLTDRTTEIKDLTTSGGISQTITQKQDYTTLGLVNSITYPSCLSGVACGVATSSSVGLTHTNGWLTSVDPPSSFGSLLYHPSGMINTVSHGNGVTDTQDDDPTNGMPRPQSITFGSFGSCVAPAFNSPPSPTLDSAVIKSGTTKTWTVSASGSGTLAYQWYKDGHAVSETSSTLTTELLYDGPHTYFVRVANSCGVIQSNTATITIAVSPSITVQPQDTTFIAPSVRLTVTVSTSTSPTPDYQWYRGMGPNDPARSQVGLNQPYFDATNLSATTRYFVHVSNIGGFVDSRTATVTVALSTPCCLTAAMPNTLSVQPVHLNWGTSSGTDHYEIWRREHAGVLHKIGESGSTSYDDSSVAEDTAYFYQICASPAPGTACTSAFSNQDLATTVAFREITVDRRVRLIDLTQLLTAVNAVRGASGNSAVNWAGILQNSPAPALNGLVYGEHIMALRTQMEAALQLLGFGQHTYADPALPSSPRVIIKAIHITELRDRIQ